MSRLLACCVLALASTAASAYPDRPVTLIVPFPPGGSTDSIARVLQPKLQEKLGGTFVVENRAGATGTLGAALVKRAAADGHTLLVSSLGPFVIAPHLIKGVQYDDLLGSQVNASFQNINAVIRHVGTGKLKALAITAD